MLIAGGQGPAAMSSVREDPAVDLFLDAKKVTKELLASLVGVDPGENRGVFEETARRRSKHVSEDMKAGAL